MARKRKDDEDEISKLEKEIRELKSINRSLLRRLRKIDKGFHEFLKDGVDEKEEKQSEQPVPSRRPLCTNCGRSELTEVTIAGRRIKRCELCGWRSKAEKSQP
jgi:hypothetical protein